MPKGDFMAWFLVKSDPDEYSLDNLEKDGSTTWDGVHSFAAIGHIKAMKPGDLTLIYHSLKEKSIVGLAEVEDHPFLNTNDPRFSWAVNLKFTLRFKHPVTLATMKAIDDLKDFMLIRQSRLSVMPVDPSTLKWLKQHIPEITKID